MFLISGSFWVSVSTLFVALFCFINRMFSRVQVEDREKSSISSVPVEEEACSELNVTEGSVSDEENSPKCFSKFQFRRYEEFIGSNSGDDESVVMETGSCSETAPISSINKYEFMSGKACGVFMEEPEAASFTVKELYAASFNEEIDEVLKKPTSEAEAVVEPEDVPDSDVIDSSGDGFLSDKTEVEDEHEESQEENHTDNMEQLRNLEQSQDDDDDDDALASDMLSKDDFHDDNNIDINNNGGKCKAQDSEDSTTGFESNGGKCKAQDWDDSTGFESLWEHQDLIEQLKMELKKVRATGLPTILEESESPKMMEDLKPWKIEDKFQQQDTMGELHRFYKCYRERMRKFDILNYQKMYAIGFLQSKDPLESISISKSSIPVIGALLSESFRKCKHKKSKSDPMVKFMRELHSDLEMVYVGQLCLSWEFLHWQYDKTLELWESDPRGIHMYNEVAGEFQQFQVLIQRFIENESFEGPRVQNYAKSRCVLRNLLQVPVIREDNVKDKRRARNEKGNDVITSDMLVEIMEESIRIFWRFLRADKDASNNNGMMQMVLRENEAEVRDQKLLMELRADLHKKERKLKDMVRSGKCILKRFQKQQEESSEQVLHFFSQVDMKLVARVLNMSRITSDQLLWCHNKLSKISFVNRKISIEPSFLLFPC